MPTKLSRIRGAWNREAGIASVLDKEEYVSSGVEGNDPRCGVCEMAVVWVQNQLTENIPTDEIDTYLNQVYPEANQSTNTFHEFDALDSRHWFCLHTA